MDFLKIKSHKTELIKKQILALTLCQKRIGKGVKLIIFDAEVV
jgi:hypothetical protein